MTGKVKVVVRVRPTANFASNVYKFDEGTDAIDIIHAADASHGAVNNTPENWHFKVDKLIVNATQETVFGTACDEIIRGVMEGYNGTVLAYGQTGAGKTFTISGGNGFAQRGLVPRAISRTFAEIHSRPENIISVRLSYIEIYNELMFDLLSRTPVKDQKGDLLVQEGPKGEIICRQLMVKQAPSEEMALNIFFEGDAQKALAEHALNEASSRSHTILTIYVDSRSRVESSEKITSSKFHLVDLAGSERLKKTNSEGGTLKEAGFINKSLTFLEQVVRALADKARDHVPYRQSKLTHFLKDSLGGNCKTTMIANVYPEARFLEESGSTLRFATSMMKVVNKPNVNVHMDQGLLLKKYERDIKDLKQELAMHDTLAGRGRIQYADFSPDEIRALETKIKTYVEGDVETLEIVSLKMVQESFGIFRKMIQNLQKELRERPTMLSQAVSERTATMEDGGPVGDLAPPEDQVGVDDDATNGFGIGVATTKPMDDVEAGTAGGEGDREGEVLTPRRPHKAKKEAALGPADKASVFLQWKKKEGGSFERVFQNLKSQVMQRKQECKMLIQQLNAKKQAVDALDARISQRTGASSSAQQGDLIDEEEFALLSTKQTERTQHRKLLEEKRMLDQAIVQGEQQMQACKRELVQAFEAWYSAKYETGGNATTNSPIAAVSTLDSKEQYDGLEAQRFGGDDEAYTFYKARRNAKTMKSRK